MAFGIGILLSTLFLLLCHVIWRCFLLAVALLLTDILLTITDEAHVYSLLTITY